MLRIVSKPENFTPIRDGLVFVVEADEKSDFDVRIFNTQTGEEVGRKLIYDTTTAVVDIAPYVADIGVLMAEKQSESELVALPAVSYKIEVQTEEDILESEEVLVSSNIVREVVGVNSLFEADECREIAYGDCDHLLINAPTPGLVTLEINTDFGDSYSYNIHTESGRAMFCLSTQMFEESVERIVIDIYSEGEYLQSVDYEIVPRNANAVRVMWVSDLGTLEHYTFAAVHSQTLVAKQRQTFVGTSGEVKRCSAVRHIKIGSKRCAERVLEALATIVTAPKVWIERAEGYVEAAVLENEATISQLGEVGQLVVTLEYDRKEVRL